MSLLSLGGSDDAQAAPSCSERQLVAAEEELRWYYADSAAAVGFHAAGLDAGGASVFDEMRSHQAHMSRRTHRHQKAAGMLRRIGPSILAMDPSHRYVADLAYTPHGFSDMVRVLFTVKGICLAALAAGTREATAARDEAEDPRRARMSVPEYLEREADRTARNARMPKHLATIRDAASVLLREAVRHYVGIREERVDRERAERIREEYVSKAWWETV